MRHMPTAVDLAREALEAGDDPFGSVLVGPDGEELWRGRNLAGSGDETQHPELAAAQWSARLSPAERAECTVYTSGEHCPMCSAAHGWMGLGPIIYAVSSAQLSSWRESWGAAPSPVVVLPIHALAPSVPVSGPVAEFEEEMYAVHRAAYERSLRTPP